jgi:crotonobetainyl-CoA:carnitine CoA-transferase CaiB-like acyl-CoA transferase
VASITGYGQDGPLANTPGHDLNFSGYAGFVAAAEDGAPYPVQVADLAGGALTACVAILAALFGRERSGRGRALDISMSEGALALIAPHLACARAEERNFRPSAELLSGGLGNYRTYVCKDGKALCFAPLEPKFWIRFCEIVGRQALPDPEALKAFFLERDREEWVALLEEVCVSPALTVEEIFENAHFKARECFEKVLGIDMVRAPFPYARDTHVPVLGEDTERILAELDIDRASLYAAKIAATQDSTP